MKPLFQTLNVSLLKFNNKGEGYLLTKQLFSDKYHLIHLHYAVLATLHLTRQHWRFSFSSFEDLINTQF